MRPRRPACRISCRMSRLRTPKSRGERGPRVAPLDGQDGDDRPQPEHTLLGVIADPESLGQWQQELFGDPGTDDDPLPGAACRCNAYGAGTLRPLSPGPRIRAGSPSLARRPSQIKMPSCGGVPATNLTLTLADIAFFPSKRR